MKLSQLFDEKINVSEAFDSKFDDISWENFNDALIGRGHIDGEEFRLYIEPAEFTVGDESKTWVNVAFARIINGMVSQDLIQTGKNQSRQLGAIVNSLTEKLKEVTSSRKIDAVVFIVEKGQEKRIPLYKRLMLSKVYGIRPWQYRLSIEWFGGTALVATEKLMSKDEMDALEADITSRRKRMSWQ